MAVRGELQLTLKGREQAIHLTSPRFTIGRGEENSLCLTEPMVSRYHAEVIRIGDDFLLRDHGSTNGSFVNDARISEQILADGDTIRFGKGGPEIVFQRIEATDDLTSTGRASAGTTENLIDSLSLVLATKSTTPEEAANVRCILAGSYLKKGQLDKAAETIAIYKDPAVLAELPVQLQATTSLTVGEVKAESKRYTEAVEALRRAIDLFGTQGDQTGVAEAHAALGRALIGAGDLIGARDSLHRALLAARRSGNDVVTARVHLATGRIDWKEGDLEGARYHWNRAARIAERANDEVLSAQVQMQQAFVLYSEGRFAEAVPAYQAAITLIEAIGHVRLLLKAYGNLSRVLTRQGLWLATERLLATRLRIARENGLTKPEAVALTDQAELRLLQGHHEEARRIIEKAVALHGTVVYARTQRILGRILAACGDPAEAIRELERGLVAARAKGTLEEQVLVGLELASVLVDVRDYSTASVRLEEAESITSLDPALAMMGRAIFTRGTLQAARGHVSEANRSFSQSMSIFQTIGDPYRLGLCHAALGALRSQMGRNESARAHLEEAHEIFMRIGAGGELSRVKERLASTVLMQVRPALTGKLTHQTATRTGAATTIHGYSRDEVFAAAEADHPFRVLLAASNEGIASVLKRGLEVENYIVDRVEHGRAALERSLADAPVYDVLLLDALLEFQSGYDICRELRQRERDVPVILLGSRQSVEDKIDALHVGADDYLCQHGIVLEELLAKMEALLR